MIKVQRRKLNGDFIIVLARCVVQTQRFNCRLRKCRAGDDGRIAALQHVENQDCLAKLRPFAVRAGQPFTTGMAGKLSIQ